MTSFCGINYDELKSVVTLTCLDTEDGLNIREGIELESNMVGKFKPGEVAHFAGEIFRARDGSVRIRFLDGRGFTSIYSRDGSSYISAPATPAVETTTDSAKVHTVVLRVKNHRFLASYRTVLKSLGFTSDSGAPATYPAILTFDHTAGIDRAQFVAAFEPLVKGHLAKYYAFLRPTWHKSDPWFEYEMWMEYKKEISIFAD